MSGLIKTEGLSKVYRGGVKAIKDLDLEVSQGEVFGLIGPNGAGKTTTIRMLMGVLKPTAGRIFYEEKEKIIKEQIGYLPEDARFYRFMRIEEYLQWVCKLYPVSDHKNQVASAIQTAGLEELKRRKINSLSKGQKQRLGIAQALVHGPQILILDEPTSGLDPIGKKEILTILQKLSRQGKTILISSHILPELAQICTSVGILKSGELIIQGAIEDIRRRFPASKLILKFETLDDKLISKFKSSDFVKNLGEQGGADHQLIMEIKDASEAKKLIPKLIADSDSTLTYYDFAHLTLEDIFMETMRERQ